MCSFKNCFNRRTPGSKMIFFRLPGEDTDQRREWIRNSGNKDLETCAFTAQRLFCEEHFDESNIIRQFNRSILRRDSVPRHWTESSKGIDGVLCKNNEKRIRLNEDYSETETYILDFEPETETESEVLDIKETCIEYGDEPEHYVEVVDSQIQTDHVESCDKDTQTDFDRIEPPAEAPPVRVKMDEDEFFAVNVIATVLKKIPNSQKSQAKMDILNLLYQIEQGNE